MSKRDKANRQRNKERMKVYPRIKPVNHLMEIRLHQAIHAANVLHGRVREL